jgi:hypothetical protein
MAGDDVDLSADVRRELQQIATRYAIAYPVLCRVYRLGASTARVVGPTGEFPFGRLGPEDEGELAVAIVADVAYGVVRIEFGKRIAQLALPADHAEALGAVLVAKADDLRRGLS